VQRGMAYDYGRLVEERLNARLKTGNMKVFVFFVPLPRDMLLPALVDGKVDLVAAQVTVRPALQKHVDFTNATRTNVKEILVTGPGQPPPPRGRALRPGVIVRSSAPTTRAWSR